MILLLIKNAHYISYTILQSCLNYNKDNSRLKSFWEQLYIFYCLCNNPQNTQDKHYFITLINSFPFLGFLCIGFCRLNSNFKNYHKFDSFSLLRCISNNLLYSCWLFNFLRQLYFINCSNLFRHFAKVFFVWIR